MLDEVEQAGIDITIMNDELLVLVLCPKCGLVINGRQLPWKLGAATKILGHDSKMFNQAVRGDIGLEYLKGRRDWCKLKWGYKVKLGNESV